MNKKKDLSELDADLFGDNKFISSKKDDITVTTMIHPEFDKTQNVLHIHDRVGDGIITEVTKHPDGLNQLTVTPDPQITEDTEVLNAQIMIPPGRGIGEVPYKGMAYDGAGVNKLLIDEAGAYVQPKEKLWIGIDPGKSGGIVGLDTHSGFIKSIIPVIGDDVDIHALYAFFTPLKEKYNCTLILEDVHSMFKMSAGSNFTFGFVCGAIEAIVISHGFKLIKVAPKTWQKELWQNSDKQYKPLEKDQKNPSINTKLTSLICAKRLFPAFDFRKSDSIRVKNDHDGIIDGCLIAEYGRRKNL